MTLPYVIATKARDVNAQAPAEAVLEQVDACPARPLVAQASKRRQRHGPTPGPGSEDQRLIRPLQSDRPKVHRGDQTDHTKAHQNRPRYPFEAICLTYPN